MNVLRVMFSPNLRARQESSIWIRPATALRFYATIIIFTTVAELHISTERFMIVEYEIQT
jgi:hypothetical protein